MIADSLSCQNQVLGSEWTLAQDMVDSLLARWPATVNLFAISLTYRLPVYVSPLDDPMSAGIDTFLQTWDRLQAYAFTPFALIHCVINKLLVCKETYITLIAPFWPQKEWFPELQSLAVAPPVPLSLRRDLLRQPHFYRLHQNLPVLRLHVWRLFNALPTI